MICDPDPEGEDPGGPGCGLEIGPTEEVIKDNVLDRSQHRSYRVWLQCIDTPHHMADDVAAALGSIATWV